MLALFVVAPACKKNEAEPVIATHQAKVRESFAAAKRIGDQVKGLPPLAKDGARLEAGPVKLPTALFGTPTDTAMMDDAEGLANPESPPTFRTFKLDRVGQLGWCAKLLGTPTASKAAAESAFGLCTQAKYLLVVRVFEHRPPKVDTASKTFQSGLVRGEVRVMPFPTGKDLGGFRFKAENDAVTTATKSGDAAVVEANLNHKVQEAVNAGIRTHLAP